MPGLVQRSLLGVRVGSWSGGQLVKEPLYPAVSAVLAAQPQHGGGITHRLVRRFDQPPTVVLDAAHLFTDSNGGEQIEEGQPARGKPRLHLLDYLSRLRIRILTFQRIHAYIAHENREARNETGMPVAERVAISPHLIKHVVRDRFGVGFEFGIIIVVEHRQLNPRGPDVTTTRSAG